MQFASDLLKPLARSLNLSLTSFGEAITDPTLPTYGSIVLSDPWNTKLEPAPISPYKSSPASRIVSGTIKGTYNAHRGLEGDDNIMVYPSYLFGNTGKGFDFVPSFGEHDHELLMQILGSTGSYRKIFTGTIMMISIREMDLVGSIPSTKVRRVLRLLSHPLFSSTLS